MPKIQVPNSILTSPKMYQNPLTVVPYQIHRRLIIQFMKCHMLQIKDLPFVAMIMSETRCLILFIDLEFKHMNDIIKTITPSSEMVTNLSNDNVSLQTKIKSLEEEIKSRKNENSNLKGDIKTQLKVIENLSRFENRHCKDLIANKDKVNENNESNDLKNEGQWQITTSRNKHGHSTNAGKSTLERNKKSNDIYFKLSNRFSPLHNDDQNLTKGPTSTNPNTPQKIPTNSRNTSPYAINNV